MSLIFCLLDIQENFRICLIGNVAKDETVKEAAKVIEYFVTFIDNLFFN